MGQNIVAYNTVCTNKAEAKVNLSFSLSPLDSGMRLARMVCSFDKPAGRQKSWSREVRSGHALFRWMVHVLRDWARVSLHGYDFEEITGALSEMDERLGEEFLDALVEYLVTVELSSYEEVPPRPPTLAGLIAYRAEWLDPDTGGGGSIGRAIRGGLRYAAMSRFIAEYLTSAGSPPMGVNTVNMTYGPPGSGSEIEYRSGTGTGTVQGRFRVSERSVSEAQDRYDAFFRGPFGVLAGLSSCEAGWYDSPLVSVHETYESAVRRYRYLRPRLLRKFVVEAQITAVGIRKGWLTPTDPHSAVLVIMRPSTDGDSTEVIGSLAITWEPYEGGLGNLTSGVSELEWNDYFPAANKGD